MHLKDPHAHKEMIEALEGRYKAEECSLRTIYGTLDGYKVYADRSVSQESRFSPELEWRVIGDPELARERSCIKAVVLKDYVAACPIRIIIWPQMSNT